jgi:hypothetical protein
MPKFSSYEYFKSISTVTITVFLLGITCFGTVAFAADDSTQKILYQPNPDSPIGERNESAAPELAQYDFLIGDWDVDITWNYPGQEPTKSKAKWHNHWVVNGTVVMLEWRGTQFTGTEIRTWHPANKKWVGINVYPAFGGGYTEVTSEKIGDKMFVTVPTNGPDGAFINRETYYNIEADSYKMKSEHSYDDGETWTPGLYEMTVLRTSRVDGLVE